MLGYLVLVFTVSDGVKFLKGRSRLCGGAMGNVEFSGKVALVTGAGSGIGRTVAIMLAQRGASVIVADTNRKAGEQSVKIISENRARALFSEMDVSNSEQVRKQISKSVSKLGRLDILVNNAGISLEYGPIMKVTEQAWDRTIDVNLKGVFLCSKYSIREMIRKDETGDRGVIVNIASVDGLYAVSDNTPYCASKGGIIALTKAMALDCAPLGIRVNCICPGAVMTPLQARIYRRHKNPRLIKELYDKGYPIGRVGKPEEIADLVSFLASNESSFITGSMFIADGGMHAQYGEVILDKVAKGVLKS